MELKSEHLFSNVNVGMTLGELGTAIYKVFTIQMSHLYTVHVLYIYIPTARAIASCS